jgi:hypothetical protein
MAVRKDLRSTSGESDYLLALTRLRPEQRPGEISSGYAAALAWRNASGTAHNTHCPFGRASHLNSDRADNSPLAGPFGPEFRSDNVALCAIPLRHCHGAGCPDLAFVRRTESQCGTHRASLQASCTPTPPLMQSDEEWAGSVVGRCCRAPQKMNSSLRS